MTLHRTASLILILAVSQTSTFGNDVRAQRPNVVQTRSPAATKKPAKTRRRVVYCATNRLEYRDKDGSRRFSAKIGPLRYLKYDLTIDPMHKPGRIGDINIARETTVSKRTALFDQLRRTSDAGILIFIHGFYVGHRESVQRAAQIANELDYHGVIFAFSWPSLCRFNRSAYLQDRKTLDDSVQAVHKFLKEMTARIPHRKIHILAHSLAGRLISKMVMRWNAGDRSNARFANIVFAAPDVDAQDFQKQFAKPLTGAATKLTICFSKCDPLLGYAQTYNNNRPRLGRSGIDAKSHPGIHVIDYTNLGCSFGTHNFYREHPELLKQIRAVLGGRKKDCAGRTVVQSEPH